MDHDISVETRVYLHDRPEKYIPRVQPPQVTCAADSPRMMSRIVRTHGSLLALGEQMSTSIVAAGADVVAELSDEKRFCKHVGDYLVNLRTVIGDGLFTAYNSEPQWAAAHGVLMPAFALSSMRDYHPTMVQVCQRLLRKWDRCAANGIPVAVSEDMTNLTLDTIGLAGFGFDFESFTRPTPHPFISAMVNLLLAAQEHPDLVQITETMQQDMFVMHRVVDEVIAERRTREGSEKVDLLGLMLNSRGSLAGPQLNEANIRNQIITFLIAGHETTSGALAFALYYLVKNPAVLAKAQQEVDALWGPEPVSEPAYADVSKLKYVSQVLKESLRLWPTAPGYMREARYDTTLCGFPLQAGQPIYVDLPLLHRDPVFGDNPELFDPARFSPEAFSAQRAAAFKPFGTGERACIGRQFALHEATMLLGLLIHRYRFIDEFDYQLDIKQTLTVKPVEFHIKLLDRTPMQRQQRCTPAAATRPTVTTERPHLFSTPSARTPLTVLYGSNLGASRDVADQLATLAADLGFTTAVQTLNDAVGHLPTDGPTVIVTSSYNGQPTDDATEFVAWLEDPTTTIDSGVRYAVLGIGDSNWAATYQHVPSFIDEHLHKRGASRLLARGTADVAGDFASMIDAYIVSLRAALCDQHETLARDSHTARSDESRLEVVEITGNPRDWLTRHHHMVPMEVVQTNSLVDTSAGCKDKRLVRLQIPDQTSYQTGDHLAVLPTNDPEMVQRIAEALGVDLETRVSIRGRHIGRPLPIDQPITGRELLTHFVELHDRPSQALLAALTEANPCPPEQVWLHSLAESADTEPLPSLLDILQIAPAVRERISWKQLIELLPPLRPRIYSISSSPGRQRRQIDLMISPVPGGVASSYLRDLREGDRIYAAVRPCRNAFRIDHLRNTPTIMVAAGTGLAPFRGAIADRHALCDNGTSLAPALLYFGCRNEADFLYRDELTAAEHSGAVTIRTAFSRPNYGSGRRVQDQLIADADELWQLLNAGARIYVCGDGAAMAPAVRDALRQVYRLKTGADEPTVERLWCELQHSGRYAEDVYIPSRKQL
ncbi:sulfite reductase subunit alpha (flavoprotein) [Mycobacteroides abscessus subsp. bolletii]|uniref:bifunctional cytochrome P450/NADPH--P450 reductase n=1 Tax=Mycobacteroides abscessus TaxID=36809 RepID=UPI00092A1C65|nr:cytochrome P450 [Mycobacteroides abscessus]SIJ07434.1 sulfite reductase subunit alpha (flavoprotein) [Mycobacteroides abscessus subsp. bolletii]SLD80153.1 sulfite reductase subunit alpha (flavoprotein) [Mycobacteroides abscessus subsp. bolletii]SLD87084.1 sulfite reductase subunit alpha (flavoprotein) [Mycobacteroides abscessus subsp. bolletii]